MKILVLGGTGFFGPHLVEAALSRKHDVTLFNRGKTNPHLFPELEKLQGDRDPQKGNGLKALEGRSFDACVDNSGYFPRAVKASAELLAKNGLKQYVFISSVSVYPMEQLSKGGIDETAPVGTMNDPTVETMGDQFENYGPLKALCEQAAEAAMPGRTTNIRPGLIVGPGDSTDRYTYWPVRIDRGGQVLAPNCPEHTVQYIDVRDLAEWTVKMLEDGHAGVFNGLGPRHPLTWQAFLYACKGATTSDAEFVWVDEEFLIKQGVGPWMELPLWIPSEGKPPANGVSNAKAIAVGLIFRPASVTAKDTLDWFKSKWPDGREKWRAGLSAEKEQRVLEAWRERSGKSTNERGGG